MGFALSGAGIGGVLAPGLIWIAENHGWRSLFVVVALFTFLVCIPLSLVLRDAPEPYGQFPDGKSPTHRDLASNLQDDSSDRHYTGREAVRTRAFWILAIAYTGLWLALSGLLPHLLTYLDDIEIEGTFATFSLTVITTSSIAGRLAGGWLSDLVEKRYVFAGALALGSLGMAIMAFVTEGWHLFLCLILIGPAFGTLVPTFPALVSETFGTRSFALVLGLVMVPGTLVVFVVPPLVGFAWDLYETYRPAWLVLAALTLALAPATLRLRGDASRSPG